MCCVESFGSSENLKNSGNLCNVLHVPDYSIMFLYSTVTDFAKLRG